VLRTCPSSLTAYQERLGVDTAPRTYEEGAWRQQEGETVFAPFQQDSEMIGPPEHTWMINFRVDDLDAIVDQLRSVGETVDARAHHRSEPSEEPRGRGGTSD
jgi:glyoxylase I family protein